MRAFIVAVALLVSGCVADGGGRQSVHASHQVDTSSGNEFVWDIDLEDGTYSADIRFDKSSSAVTELEVIGLGDCAGRNLGPSVFTTGGTYGFSCHDIHGPHHSYGFRIQGSLEMVVELSFRPAR